MIKSKPIFLLLGLLLISTLAQDNSLDLPNEVINFMAGKMDRHHHLFFHVSRALWAIQDQDLQHEVAKLGWNSPRSTRAFTPDGADLGLHDNDSGQDFLFRHRDMIRNANRVSKEAGSSWRVEGWDNIPKPSDKDYPVPPVYTVDGNDDLNEYIKQVKSVDFYNNVMKPWEDKLNDEDHLKQLTMGELGSEIEHGIHIALYWRFSEESAIGYRPNSTYLFAEVESKWNTPNYNFLPDAYSAHVNPMFWKIYGWIDNRLEDWRAVNGIDVIQWAGTWSGGPMDTLQYLWDLNPSDNEEKDD